MKRITSLPLILMLIAMSGCSKYAMVSMNYPVAPQAELPETVKTIALVNRSLTSKDDKPGKILESVITGEIEVSDRKASEQCITGVLDRINGYDNFRCVIPSNYKLYGSGTRQIPEALQWDIVEDICKTTSADALLVLEMFDSNSDMFAVPKILFPKPVDDERSYNVLMYWRLYDYQTRQIIDQYECSRQITFHSHEGNVVVPPKALHGAAYSAGEEYIERFLPGYFIVDRPVYKKGKGSGSRSFQSAFRHIETNDWEGAADTWEQILSNDIDENKGRACLNMAVYYEHAGDINAAIDWARKAYVDYGITKGRDYENALRRL